MSSRRAPDPRRPLVVVLALVLSVLAGVAAADATVVRRIAAQVGLPLSDAPPVIRIDDATVEIAGGTATLADVARVAEARGASHVVGPVRDGWDVHADIHVLGGARLDVHDVVVRSTHGIESRGGEIDVRGAELIGWDATRASGGGPDTDPTDGRAWLAARDGGRLDITDSRLRHLGGGQDAQTGVSWTGPDTRGRLSGSRLDDVHTVSLHEAGEVSIDGTDVRRSVGDGVRQRGGGPVSIDGLSVVDPGGDGIRLEGVRGGTVADAIVSRARGAGVAVLDDSVGVTLHDSEVHGGRGAGVVVHDTQGVVLRDNVVYDNEFGIVVEGAALRSTVTANRVAANAAEGVFVRNAAEDTVVRGNHIDRNGRAGVALVAADAAMTSNVVELNADGVRLGDRRSTGAIVDNRITGNIEDGIDLPEGYTLPVRDNVIADNRRGAFSVLTAGRSDAVAADNTLRDNGDGQERIRER